MSERRKLSLTPEAKEAAANPTGRKPVRPNAPIVRDRVRRAEPEAETPAAQEAPAERHASPRSDRSDRGDRRERADRPRDDAPRPPLRGEQGARPAGRSNPRPPQRESRGDYRDDHRGHEGGYRSEAPRDQRYPERPAGRAPIETPRQAPEDGRVRLSKLMSEQGLSSRREADDWIVQGWVSVDGEVVTELGTRVWPHQTITVDSQAKVEQSQRVTILLNKPIGYVSGQAEDGYDPAVVLVRPENRWSGDTTPWQLTRGHLHKLAPAGRLDIDSTGLLVLTQDGRIARHLIGEDAIVEKEYLVRVQSMAQPDAENVSAVLPEDQLELLRHGLSLDDKPLKPAKVSWQNEQQLRFVLREGKKRQIRRMCEQVGLKVVGLKRVRMGQVVLGKLPLGQWRFLGPHERF
ncbi:pseudouridine synthase [Aquabacterium soli]|uniref:Dual-specificity RNA pseudouridine synthase RluF n=1 Tax=Aquabacterium soli TaxID=2493092 RepID=A0A3R8TBK2_9BURK|nr:pseudouridine synthase [Aquabacterium soli]